MNVYQCWYRGLSGYCCRNHNLKWMFVPEMGQYNNNVHKHISLNDLVFNNVFAKQYELKIEHRIEKQKSNPLYFLKWLFFPEKKPNTVAGLLFATI